MNLELGTTQRGTAFRLPLELATQSTAILAKRGVGKTYTAAVIMEELLAAGQVPVVIDPTGAHWGIKASADGKGKGFPVVIFGGEHADLPLEEGSGEAIVRAIVEQRFPAIIDVSMLRKGAVRRFMVAFLETLYRLNRLPLTLVVDESDDICPQKPFGDEAQMVGAMEDVVKRGRKKGLGVILITQRPADLAKQVLTQCEVLVAMRLVHPLDIKAVMEWVHVHADTERARQMVESLPSLPIGTAWFWSPGFGDIFEKVVVRRRTTFDSSATPKPGEKVITPKQLAQADLTKLGADIAASLERAKENDPAALKTKLAALQKEHAKLTADLAKPQPSKVETVQLPVLSDADRAVLDGISHRLAEMAEDFADVIGGVTKRIEVCEKAQASAVPRTPPARPQRTDGILPRATATLRVQGVSHVQAPAPEVGTGGKRRILIALAQYPDGMAARKLSLLTGISASGGTWRTYLGELRGAGWVEGGSDHMRITEAGVAALGSYTPLPTGEALREYWRQRLGDSGKRRIFDVVVEAYPRALSYEEVSQATGIDTAGGTWRTYLGELRGLELLVGRGDLKASAELFED
jgi:hypothetical protein